MKQFGIDISTWQGNFDMAKAKAEGATFVVIKGGGGDDGLYTDKRFVTNYNNAKKLGMLVGCYWFSKALTVDQAKSEAKYFYTNVLKGRQFELPVYIDVENKTQLGIGKRKLTDVVKAWLECIASYGYYGGIYSSKSYFSSYLYDNELTKYPHWVACWAKSCSYAPESCFGMWQFGGETNLIRSNKVAGVTCDQDYLLIDYPSIIKAGNYNGFSGNKTETKTGLKVGDSGIQVRYLQQNLNGLGYPCGNVDGGYGKNTQNGVTLFQQNNGLKATGQADDKTLAEIKKQVTELQNNLNKLGYNCGTADGVIGDKTVAALKQFQKAKGLVADGVYGKNSAAAMKAALSAPVAPTTQAKPRLQKGSQGSAVKELQTALTNLGYPCGNIDGGFGNLTLASVLQFQRDAQIDADGVVGPQTWSAIEKWQKATYKARVNVGAGLNIRASYTTDSNRLGVLSNGAAITVTLQRNGFGKLGSRAGWVALQYTKKV